MTAGVKGYDRYKQYRVAVASKNFVVHMWFRACSGVTAHSNQIALPDLVSHVDEGAQRCQMSVVTDRAIRML